MIESDSSLFKVEIENYNGSLEVLLDLAKAQKVNLEDISITKLADQFHDYITNNKELNLEINFKIGLSNLPSSDTVSVDISPTSAKS